MTVEVSSLIRERKFVDAFRLANRLADERPHDLARLIVAGEAALHVQKHAEAHEYAMRALRIAPASTEAFLISVTALRCSREFADAEQLLANASRYFTFSASLEGKRLQELGLLYFETGRVNHALRMHPCRCRVKYFAAQSKGRGEQNEKGRPVPRAPSSNLTPPIPYQR